MQLSTQRNYSSCQVDDLQMETYAKLVVKLICIVSLLLYCTCCGVSADLDTFAEAESKEVFEIQLGFPSRSKLLKLAHSKAPDQGSPEAGQLRQSLEIVRKWPNDGGGIQNRRQVRGDCKINPTTAPTLTLKWKVITGEDVTSTPSISDGILYFPTWNGSIYAVREEDGSVVWKRNLTEVARSNRIIISRNTPVVATPYLLVGIYTPGLQLALNIATGDLIWSATLDTHLFAAVTMSGTVYQGEYYVGTTSVYESEPPPCCSFQASMVKLNLQTGRVVWQTSLLPSNDGKIGEYSGAALWGSSPSIDTKRKHVYIASGNLYSTPANVTKCQQLQNNKTIPDIPDPCIEPGDHSESILALDLDTGDIVWSHHLGAYDTSNLYCAMPGNPNCPPIPGPDYDFGEMPMMLTIERAKNAPVPGHIEGHNHQGQRDVVVAGAKSGIVWALDRDDGSIVWSTVAGPGGVDGGAVWGSATDGKRVYTNIVNNERRNFTLFPITNVVTSGGWVAINASTGAIVWIVATPDQSYGIGPVSVVDGVVFVTSFGIPEGSILALEAHTGAILWSKKLQASIIGGISIHHNCVYLGEGLSIAYGFSFPSIKHGVAVDAFCLQG